jgi:hypothetical protein
MVTSFTGSREDECEKRRLYLHFQCLALERALTEGGNMDAERMSSQLIWECAKVLEHDRGTHKEHRFVDVFKKSVARQVFFTTDTVPVWLLMISHLASYQIKFVPCVTAGSRKPPHWYRGYGVRSSRRLHNFEHI